MIVITNFILAPRAGIKRVDCSFVRYICLPQRTGKIGKKVTHFFLVLSKSELQSTGPRLTRPRGYKTFFMLKSAEHEIIHANKSQITNNAKFFLAKYS